MSGLAVSDDQRDRQYLAAEEVLEQLGSLSSEDKIRLRLVERRRCVGTDFREGQLYHESVCRILAGNRKCPKEVPVLAFLMQTIRSLASHRREQLAAEREIKERHREISELEVLTDQHNPEAALIQREENDAMTAIYDCMEGDDEAQKIILAIIDGKKGKELRDEIGLDQAGYDYAMKRIRKDVRKKFPTGIVP